MILIKKMQFVKELRNTPKFMSDQTFALIPTQHPYSNTWTIEFFKIKIQKLKTNCYYPSITIGFEFLNKDNMYW